jgi:hypothetical protein
MAPTPSLYFDSSDQTPPNKQTNDSERDPDSSPPPHGDGEWRRHVLLGTAALPMEREGKAARGRAAAAHRVCVCVCVC